MIKRVLLLFFIAIASLGMVQYVFSLSTGITGFSGKSGGAGCNTCHYGGVTPEVSITGPHIVSPGATHIYTLTISGGQEVAGGLNVAAADGNLFPFSGDTQLLNNEITHTAPKAVNQDGAVVFAFAWTAPITSGVVTLYGAGNSVNGNGSFSGDAGALTTLSLAVMEVNAQIYLPLILR